MREKFNKNNLILKRDNSCIHSRMIFIYSSEGNAVYYDMY